MALNELLPFCMESIKNNRNGEIDMTNSDGRYVFERCMPDGDVTIASVAPGEILKREFSFRVNAPVKMQEQLNGGQLDPRNILHGADGELYDGDGNFLAEVNEWEALIVK